MTLAMIDNGDDWRMMIHDEWTMNWMNDHDDDESHVIAADKEERKGHSKDAADDYETVWKRRQNWNHPYREYIRNKNVQLRQL